MNLPDGVYNGKYNSEVCIIRLKYGIPVWVQFIGYIKHYEGKDKRCYDSLFDPIGIMHSNVELLIPSQEIVS